MRIGILAFSEPKFARYTFIDEIAEAIEAKGHEAVKLYTTQLSFLRLNGKLEILHDQEPLGEVDVIIARPNFLQDPGMHAYPTQLLEHAGYKVINSWPCYGLAKNKIDQHVRSLTDGLAMPKWAIAKSTKEILINAVKIGFPIILKIPTGSFGRGVFYADSLETLRPIADYLTARNPIPIILEEFIGEADRKDVRIFIVDGKIIAAMERSAPEGDIRTNTSNGGVGAKAELTEEEADLALRAAKQYNLEIAGIDIMRSEKGPVLIEVNANPGFEELQKTTETDIAGTIVDYAIKVANKES
jgi:ribosomal protein S6--L-glutamate ligase